MKDQRRIDSFELIELIDLEERKELASYFELSPPQNLKDTAFVREISRFSTTTLLSAIIKLRRPFIHMLQEIFSFMQGQECKGRTTTRAVVLENLQKELDFFDTALQKAIATTLNSRSVSVSKDSLEMGAEELKGDVIKEMHRVCGSSVRVKSWGYARERFFRNSGTPSFDYFGDRAPMFHPADKKKISALHQEFNQLLETLDKVAQRSDQGSWLINQTVDAICLSLRAGQNALRRKLSEINLKMGNAQRIHKEFDLKPQISKLGWEKILERFRILKEEILAACDFEVSANTICDFLNLELWRERWRIYELWMLIHLLELLESLGFKVDLSGRVIDGVWDLKFTKDERPAALLLSEDVTLEVYYQLYTRGTTSGDMPDIAVKSSGDFLIILDPKHGTTYSLAELTKVAERYINLAAYQRSTSLSSLTIIHNFYPLSYSHETVSQEPRGLVMSDVRPGSANTWKIDREIVSIIPEGWVTLPEGWVTTRQSIIIMIDVSASTASVRDKLSRGANDIYRDYYIHANPGSAILLFDDKIVKEIAFSEADNFVDDVSKYSGGGTNLAVVLDIAIERLAGMSGPRSLVLFTDGQDSFDSARVSAKLRSAEVELQVTESVASDKVSSLQKLVREFGGKYDRI